VKKKLRGKTHRETAIQRRDRKEREWLIVREWALARGVTSTTSLILEKKLWLSKAKSGLITHSQIYFY
jgi:hypothetical protein